MPRPATTQAQAQELAKLSRAIGYATPFARDSNRQQWVYSDMGVREALLDCVQEILTGSWYSHIDPMPGQGLGEAYKSPGQLRLQYLDHWLTTLCTSYKDEPTRRIMRDGVPLAEDDPLVVAVNKAYDEMAVNMAMQYADKAAFAFGNVVMRVYIDEDFGRWVLHTYTSQCVRVVENDNNPAMPWATVLTGQVLERLPGGKAAKVPMAEVWIAPTKTEAGSYQRIGNGATKPEPLETEAPPLVHVFNTLPTNLTRYHVEGPGLPLARLNVAINEDYLCRLGYTTLMQAHGQLVLTNPGQQAKIEIGPGRAITLTGDPETLPSAQFISPGADLAGFVEVIRSLLAEIRTVYGIPNAEIEVGTDPASGAAIVQANAPLAERRAARMKIFREPERQLLRATIDMGKTHGIEGFAKAGDPSEYDVSVKFGESQTSVSVTDKIALEKHDLQLGLITRGELLMRRYPDRFASVAEAETWLEENAEKLAADKAMSEPPKPEGFGGGDEEKSEKEKKPVDKPTK